VEYYIPVTLFEVTFITGCLYYETNGCDVVVLEVGVGGQMDATNVVDAVLSVICSICKF
jgi:dihydrofolate synthase/folylpolyglutamate synthase